MGCTSRRGQIWVIGDERKTWFTVAVGSMRMRDGTHLGLEVQDLHHIPHQVRKLLVHLDLLEVLLHLLLVALQIQRQPVALVPQHPDLVLQQPLAHLDVLQAGVLELPHHVGLALIEHAVQIHDRVPPFGRARPAPLVSARSRVQTGVFLFGAGREIVAPQFASGVPRSSVCRALERACRRS